MEKTYPFEIFKNTLVDRYASKDDLRPQYCHANDYYSPVDEVNYWCVTDCFIMIMIPHHLIGPSGSSEVKIGNALPNSVIKPPVLFTINEFKQALDKCHSAPGYTEEYGPCPDCKGEGNVIDPDDEEELMSCDKCDGEGEIVVNKIPTGLIAYPEQDEEHNIQVIQLMTAKFFPQILNRMVQAIELLQLQDNMIQVISHAQSGATFIVVGEVKFLIMPVRDFHSEYANLKATIGSAEY